MTATKGHDVLVEALARLPHAAFTCACVGALDRDPAFVAGLRRALAAADLDGRVALRGPLHGTALAAAFAAADALVLASRAEAYGMVVTEALARGLPVLASDVGGVPEALGAAADGTRPGLLVPPGDADALARALQAWLAEPALRERLRAAARERRGGLAGWGATAAGVAGALATLAG